MQHRRGKHASGKASKTAFFSRISVLHAASVLCAASLCLVIGLFGFVLHADDEAAVEVNSNLGMAGTGAVTEVKEPEELLPGTSVSKGVMPAYLQVDSRWAGIAYAGGTIETNGCGLTCAAASFQYLTGIETTPASLQAEVGDSCTDGNGNNDMALFIQWMQGKDSSIKSSGQLWLKADLLDQIQQKHVVFLAVSGTFGEKQYGGHIVTLFNGDSYGFDVLDPDCKQNCGRWTYEMLDAVSWTYCYGIWKE